jgi:hypothetical protein
VFRENFFSGHSFRVSITHMSPLFNEALRARLVNQGISAG